jgi:hypothetical protein
MRQFVIQLNNQPGELAHLVRALAVRGVNIEHLACVGVGPISGAFVVPDDDETMRQVVRGMGYAYIEGDAITVKVSDRPGGLAEMTDRLAAGGVNVLGLLCIGRQPGVVEMAVTVDDEVRARAALATAEAPELVPA